MVPPYVVSRKEMTRVSVSVSAGKNENVTNNHFNINPLGMN